MAAEISLKGSTIILIGGTSGIGRGVAEAAAGEGAQVVVASRDGGRAGEVAARLGAGARGESVDVRDPASLAALFDRVGAFDHLVYSAGDWDGPSNLTVDGMELAAARAVFEVRFWGAVAAVQKARATLAPEGSITLTDGLLAHRPWRPAAVSAAMLGAIEHLTRALAAELAPQRVNAVCPGLIMTERNRANAAAFAPMLARVPLKRGGEPAEIAQAYLYLMKGAYTTGQVLIVDGGAVAV